MINAWDVRVCWGNQPSALYLPQRCIWGAGTQNPPKCPRAPNCVSSLWSYGLQKQSSPKKLSPKNVPQIVCPLCEESAVPKKDVAQKGFPKMCVLFVKGWARAGGFRGCWVGMRPGLRPYSTRPPLRQSPAVAPPSATSAATLSPTLGPPSVLRPFWGVTV